MQAHPHTLIAKDLVTGYDKKAIVRDLNLEIPDGKISVILGSNGCGKSTLLKTLCRLIPAIDGSVELDGKKLSAYHPKDLAKIIALMPQSPLVPEGISVYDLVSRGRFPYRKALSGLKRTDFDAIERALKTMGVWELQD